MPVDFAVLGSGIVRNDTMSLVSQPVDPGPEKALRGLNSSHGAETKSVDLGAEKALNRLKSTEAIEWLGPSPSLAECAKQASECLFSLTACHFEKAPLKTLYTDRFDAEQIWQQIDLQSLPVFSYIRRRVNLIEKVSVDNFFVIPENPTEVPTDKRREVGGDGAGSDSEWRDSEKLDGNGSGSASASTDNSDDDMDDDMDDNAPKKPVEDDSLNLPKNPVEDEFFKISEMENFLDKADAEENGMGEGDEDGFGEEDEEDEEAGFSEDDEEEHDVEQDSKELGFGKYNEFFGNEVTQEMSAHEKRLVKTKKRIEHFEKANIDPKDWTLIGEVTARKRPKNSALEVELDFDHNVRPPPVITEEVTASLEDMIKARIAEGRFDDVKRRQLVPGTSPKARIELDENKNQKGLGELYEADYMQQTGSVVSPATSTDGVKNEATILFKVLCHRLDALCHYHLAPKPVIEDMGVRASVPALAMEEVAAVAVSDAWMLAPEEVFKGEDGLKAEGELTPEERKRRRAQKKRKRKGEKRAQEQIQARKKPIGSTTDQPRGTPGLKMGRSSFGQSTKVFAALAAT